MAGEAQLLLQSLRSGDLWLLLCISLCYPLARWTLERTLFTWVSRLWLVPPSLRGGKLPDKITRRITKMNEAFWKLTCYLSFAVVASCALLRQSWVRRWDTREFWLGWPNQEDTSLLQWICLIEISYYVSGTGMLALWEVSRKDQTVMMVHHVLAIVIIGCCYLCNYTRACCVAMLLHDINDVIMELAKISSYNNLKSLANGLFVLFVVGWLALRMVAYPTIIIRSTLFEIVQIIGPSPPFYWVINVPILLLYCIHVYWLYLIVRVVVQLLSTGVAEDVREEDDD